MLLKNHKLTRLNGEKYVHLQMNNKQIKIIIISLLLLMGSEGMCVFGAPNWLQLKVKVFDNLTKRPILYPQFALYNAADSSEIQVLSFSVNDEHVIRVPWGNAKYSLSVMAPTLAVAGSNEVMARQIEQQGEFESEKVEITIENLKEDDMFYEVPPVYLVRKKIKRLDEVTVTASKVMFYNKGDTLVFNADAFVFAEGSSLDAIIEQLPGVELRKNGQIFVNGKFIDRLLLNGKDLFNGQNQLMLENLPAYTVKDIAVYDQQGRTSKLMGQNTGDTKHVMDVRLKRQYRTGMLVNAEGGYGTSDRYLGKLFGMLFSDNVSLSLYGGANNLSDAGKPGQSDGAWSKDRMGEGVQSRQFGGLSYIAQGEGNKWETKGSLEVENRAIDRQISSVRQDYLDSGVNYSYMWGNNPFKDFSVKTEHMFAYLFGDKADITLFPEFRYGRTRDEKNEISATFDKEAPENVDPVDVKNLFETQSDLAESLIYRNIEQFRQNSNSLEGNLRTILDVKTKSTGLKNMLRFDFNVNYRNNEVRKYNKYNIAYSENEILDVNQIFDNTPSYSWTYDFETRFRQFIHKYFFYDYFQIAYKFKRNDGRETSSLFYDDSDIKDPEQSYNAYSIDDSHSILMYLNKTNVLPKSWSLQLNYDCNVNLYMRKFDYHTIQSFRVRRNKVLPDFHLSNSFFRAIHNEQNLLETIKESSVKLNISGRPLLINLLDAVDFVNTTNPLVFIAGNPRIKDAYRFEAGTSFNIWHYRRRYIHKGAITYSNTLNARSRGIYYNTLTGHQTIRPYNVNGNWDIKSHYEFIKYLGKYRQFELSTKTSPSIHRNTELFEQYALSDELDVNATPSKRHIYSMICREDLKIAWKTGAHRLTLSGALEYRNYWSKDKSFQEFEAYNSNVTAGAIFNFPYNWSLSTDVSLYIRRGYLDSRLNTSDIIWNLRASKSFFKGKMLVVLDGFDLLHQINNVNYIINSQARTEIVTNSIPNYLLLHFQWNFNKSPGNKK